MSRKPVTTRQHLIRRNGVYQFRMRVPPDVADAFGKTHVQHSLRTKNLAEAGRLRDLWYLKYLTEFDELRAKRHPEQSAPSYTIALARLKPLVEDWLRTQLQLVASERREEPDPHRNRAAKSDPRWLDAGSCCDAIGRLTLRSNQAYVATDAKCAGAK